MYTLKEQTQFEETEKASELHSDMTEILELSAWKFKITTVNMLRDLVEKDINYSI